MMYDFTILGIKPNQLGPVMAVLPESVPASAKNGRLLGCFTCELGVLNRVAVLSAYPDAKAVAADRADQLGDADLFGVSQYLASFERATFRPFPFIADIEPGSHGGFYEIRRYEIAAGGTPETSEAWSKVYERRNQISKLLLVMTSLDTIPTRMVHIWPYGGLDERMAARAQASKEGLWPPPGGSDHLLSLQSEIFRPTAFSPLQ